MAFANAARHGVYAALLARAGMTGPAPIFEGQMGFEKELGVSLGNVGDVFVKRPEAKNVNEGTASMILNTSIKYWPAEYHSQSAIEAAMFLRKEIGDPAKIQSVRIESHDASVDIIGSEPEKWKPETRETADHSLPYITAIALHRRRSDRQTISAGAFHGSDDLEVSRKRDGAAQRRAERRFMQRRWRTSFM